MVIHTAILQHMINIAHFLLGNCIASRYRSVQEYIAHNMDREFSWGTDVEILALAHLLQTSIISYSVQHRMWQSYAPWDVDRSLPRDYSQMSIYLIHRYNHFEVACSVRKRM